ncbi:hypothetical protein GAP53_08345 [Bacteroides uniformis]|jgi:hypothetical protein|uniref:Uncharacterized protein n=2 Tax=Bacteroides TaxID=816 RepID=A0AAW7WLI3_9BACE|nr:MULTISPECIES: DUF6549 family protein [Bacteroides]KAB4219465.1 hypothetical protein GAP45_13480 [Bacteroides uniformis]KAB4222938.1 hypothetical protein GAP53_08345 [Bacteroides uniformis]KAB4225242.1 hypothetical protein GAP44_19545 [Bacteroides uniformis]KAB4236284.1 hypothetical protein GAP54_19630 [Bacteroides uniformis]KAB4241644.1 hypothetical protein GAP41_12940 [Bacteroides uniformis]
MNRILVKCLLAAVLVLGGIVWVQHRNAVRLRTERDRYRDNTETLLSDMKRIRVDSTTMAVDVNALRLRVDEYKRLRAEDAEQIKRLGVKIKNLEAAARHEVEVAGPIDAAVRDTVVIRDTVPLLRQKVEMITPYIQLTGLIEKGRLKGEIRVSVTLRQAVWVEYKGWWFWKKVKAVHQTISSDNPYAEIRYSEYIEIHKK